MTFICLMIPRPTNNKINSQIVAQDCHPVMQSQRLLHNKNLLLQGGSRAAASAPDNHLPDFHSKLSSKLVICYCNYRTRFCIETIPPFLQGSGGPISHLWRPLGQL